MSRQAGCGHRDTAGRNLSSLRFRRYGVVSTRRATRHRYRLSCARKGILAPSQMCRWSRQRSLRYSRAFRRERGRYSRKDLHHAFRYRSGARSKYGALPRIQASFRRGRVVDMLVTNKTGDTRISRQSFAPNCPLDGSPAKIREQLQGLDPKTLVQQLRQSHLVGLPRPAAGRRKKRGNIYEELLDWGAASIPPLVAGCATPISSFRRNVT